MTAQTSFSFPTSIECRSGLIQTIGKPLQALGIDRPLVVCDRFLPETEAFEKVRGALQQAGLVEDMTLFHEYIPILSKPMCVVRLKLSDEGPAMASLALEEAVHWMSPRYAGCSLKTLVLP